MGLLDILRGAADAFDVIPGFDPVKDKQGLLSQLLRGREQYGQTPPIVQPGLRSGAPGAPGGPLRASEAQNQQSMTAPGGSIRNTPNSIQRYKQERQNPYYKYKEPMTFLDGMFSSPSQKAAHHQGHMAFLEHRDMAAKAKQAAEAATAQSEQRLKQGREFGLSGRDLLSYVASGEVPQHQIFKQGDSVLQSDGSFNQAPSVFQSQKNALGQNVSFDPNTGLYNDPTGPAKPINVADGGQVYDPGTGQSVFENKKDPTGPLVQVTNVPNSPDEYASSLFDTKQPTGKDPSIVFDENGQIVVTPDMQQSAFAADALKFNEMNAKFDLAEDELDRAIAFIDGGAAAGAASSMQHIPIVGGQTPAGGLANSLKTIKARIGFDELQAMREASPTGGALGSVSESEIDFLQSLMGSLEQDQDPTILRENLVTIRNFLRNRQGRYEKAFNVRYRSAETAISQRVEAQESIDALLDKYAGGN